MTEDGLRGEDSDPSSYSNEDDAAALLDIDSDIDGDIDEVNPDMDGNEPDNNRRYRHLCQCEQRPAAQEELSIHDSLGLEDGEEDWVEFEDGEGFGLL